MDTKDLAKVREQLEDDISKYVTASINKFKDDTGIGVENILVTLNFVQTYGQKNAELVYVATRINLNI